MTVVATPLLVVLLNAIFLLPDNWRGTIFKVLFVLVAAILPAVMYYLFIITRRPSLFDEFVTNLGRLGLLSTNRRQVDAYLQRFEAAYGPLPDHEGTLDEIFGPTAEPSGPQSSPTGTGAGTGTGWGRLVETRVGSLMTPSILLPQALCTLLVGLGWMLVLPVWDLNVSLVEPEMTPVGFGFLGAYFYSMQALFRRFLRRDLRPAVYIAVAQRVVLTLIGTWVLTAFLGGLTSGVLTSTYSSVSGLLPSSKAAQPASAGAETSPPLTQETDPTNSGSPGQNNPSESEAQERVGQVTSGQTNPNADAGSTDETDSEQPAGREGAQPAATGLESSSDPAPQESTSHTEVPEESDTSQTETPGDAAGARSQPDGQDPELPRTLLVMSFLIGMFPSLLWEFLSSKAARLAGARTYLERMKPSLPLKQIDGLSFWHEARLQEEDIESAPNLAAADMVELMLNTRFTPNRLIDWIDQAILVTALGSDESGHGGKLRAQGIRTASALLAAYEKASAEPHNDLDAFEKVLRADDRSPVRTLADTLSTNPNLALIQNWQRRSADPDKKSAE